MNIFYSNYELRFRYIDFLLNFSQLYCTYILVDFVNYLLHLPLLSPNTSRINNEPIQNMYVTRTQHQSKFVYV